MSRTSESVEGWCGEINCAGHVGGVDRPSKLRVPWLMVEEPSKTMRAVLNLLKGGHVNWVSIGILHVEVVQRRSAR